MSASSGRYQDTGLFARWARFAVRRRRLVLVGWIAGIVAMFALMGSFGGDFANSFELPGTESQRAIDLLEGRFPQRAGGMATVAFQSEGGITQPETRARIEALLAELQALPGVVGVESPFAPNSQQISQDGRIAYAEVLYDKQAGEVPAGDVDKLFDVTDAAAGNGLIVETGGDIVQAVEQEPPGTTEAIGLLAAVFILLIAFGSVVAMGLPLTTAIVGLGVSFAFIGLSANVLDLPIFSSSFAAMIGLGVGIDYALLIVTRYREGLHHGMEPEDAVVSAIATAGRSVLFAGAVVVIAMLGMLSIGIPFVGALGIAGAIVVAMAVVVALTLLPALLGFAGRTIDRWRLPIASPVDTGSTSSVWYRLSAAIQRRPWTFFLLSLGAMLLMAAPVLGMRLGASDAGNSSTSLHTRRAYDLLADGFGAGFNGPLLIVFDLQGAGPDAIAGLERTRTALTNYPGIAFVTPVTPNPAGDAAIVTVFPATSPQDSATQRLVDDLRADALPAATAGTGVQAYVTGSTAAFIDISERIIDRLPLFFGAVIGLSFLLLMAVFRSVLVPLKAAIMNLLSIGASIGVIVAVFQWGWLAGLIGVKEGPIESFLPMMLFAILFGLSMDYEVFLISRIREEYMASRKNAESVARGLAVTARVITAAAAIMICVFGSFILGPDRVIKEFGLGLAIAIFVDATIVRLILVPATMELLGDANWWLPRWLDRLLPRLDVEGSHTPAPEPVAAD